MSSQLKVVILYGGKSGEHEVSLRSAASVLKNLNRARYEIIPVGIDKKGSFFLNDYDELLTYETTLPVSTPHSQPIKSLIEDGVFFIKDAIVFPVIHGPLYEDGCLQGLLKLAGVPVVGCGVLSSAIGMDKDMARRVLRETGITSARYKRLSIFDNPEIQQQILDEAVRDLGWPLIVKPCSLGSSVGISKVDNPIALKQAVDKALAFDEEVLIETFIIGREIELAVLENRESPSIPLVSVAGEIKVHHQDGFYSYDAKYTQSEKTQLIVPAIVDSTLLQTLQTMAATVFMALKCRGFARVDFFVNDALNTIYFNEINTLPGFTSISMYPLLWVASGLSYASLLDNLIELALMHHQVDSRLVTHYAL